MRVFATGSVVWTSYSTIGLAGETRLMFSLLLVRTCSMFELLFLQRAERIRFSARGEILIVAGHFIYLTIGLNLLLSTPEIGRSTEIRSAAASFSLIVWFEGS